MLKSYKPRVADHTRPLSSLAVICCCLVSPLGAIVISLLSRVVLLISIALARVQSLLYVS